MSELNRRSPESLQDRLEQVMYLLEREAPDGGPSLQPDNVSELQLKLEELHPADIAYILESLPLEERLTVWQLIKSDRDGEILLEVSDAVRETLIADMDSHEIIAAANTLDADELAARLAGQTYSLEIADDAQERRQGLMGRTNLAPNTGMLFDFPAEVTPVIWMRNMHIPLDLVYLDQNARITHLFERVPPCKAMPCELYKADRPLRFVVEIPAVSIAELGLEVGQRVDLKGREAQAAPRD